MTTLLALILFLALPAMANSRLTVCTATINSADETLLLQKTLSPQDFKFVELTDFAQNKNDPRSNWFDLACASKVTCDVLLISGHFSGEFFSDYSALKLSLNQLEQKACQRSCDNILKNPKEIFLLGCNTLSEKNMDSRSPTEYYNVLRHDGFSPIRAQEIVESRYGSLGDSNKSRMDRVFSEGQSLYGFTSVTARGKILAERLKQYLQSKGDYYQYLTQEKRGTNMEMRAAFKGLNYAESKPVGIAGSGWNQICDLRDNNIDNLQKIQSMIQLLSGEKYLAYLPSLVEVLKENKFSNEELMPLRVQENLKSRVLNLMYGMKKSVLGVSYADFAYKIGWLTKAELIQFSESYIDSLFTLPISIEKKDRLCTLPESLLGSIKMEDIPDATKFLKSAEGAGILSCLNFGHLPAVFSKAILELKQTQNEKLEKQLLWMLQDVSDAALYEDGKVTQTHIRSAEEKIINDKIMKLIGKTIGNASLLYSFIPGNNLTPEEQRFIQKLILAGSNQFQGWEYARLIRVAAASSMFDVKLKDKIRLESRNSKVESAANDYFNLAP